MIEPGERFGGSSTLTAEDLDLAVRLTGGRHPVHVSEEAAHAAGLEGRIFHGAVSAAIMASAIGARFENDRIALLEQNNSYRKPVYPGDTLASQWKVQDIQPGRQPGDQVIELSGELRNQHGDAVVVSRAKVLLRARV